MTINFGAYRFSEPIKLENWTPPFHAGLYAILIPNTSAKPRPFRVIYFGESKNMPDWGFFNAHHKYFCWIREAGRLKNKLYISVYPMPKSSKTGRQIIESNLIEKYKPVCN